MSAPATITVLLHASTSRTGPQLSLVVAEDETLGAVLRRAAPSLGIDLDRPGPSHVASTLDGAWYAEAAQRSTEAMGAIARGAATLELFVYPSVLCMHGSPGILGRGHLCGWC